jgi:hypothetical protein
MRSEEQYVVRAGMIALARLGDAGANADAA